MIKFFAKVQRNLLLENGSGKYFRYIIVGIGLLVIGIFIAPHINSWDQDATSNPGTTFGKIYVDTPEVYSRERLVNDRFQQDAWLREKLNEKPKQGLQGSIGTSRQTNTNFGLELAALPSGNNPDALQTPPKPLSQPEEQLAGSAPLKDVTDTPIEEFRDAMAYREEVRNEILENQLDDRHDIAGNTLYRLKFDATVLPQYDTSAYAMVEVKIMGHSSTSVMGDDEDSPSLADERESKDQTVEPTGLTLPEWELANYLPGLDKTALNFYSSAYESWVRDINPTKYSEDEMLYGPLQGYFAVNEGKVPLKIKEKINCQTYQNLTKRDQAWKDLIARGVYQEYLNRGAYISQSTSGDDTEIETIESLCVLTGLANFIWDIRNSKSTVYTYAVTPKERVQRVYGETLAAGSVGVSVAAETAGAGAKIGHSNEREARANAIMRQPQVVGYSPKSYHSKEATMGWLIGPRYKISSDPNSIVSFRHVPSQHTLTGIISVPSWWTELELTIRTYWLDENGVKYTAEGNRLISDEELEIGDKATIALPGDLTSIVDVLDPKRREPRVDTSVAIPDQLVACEPGSVIIRGSELWRSTVVTLGAQQASSISVLPNMKGIIATFKVVEPSISGKESLYLWTSEGEQKVRDIEIMGDCIRLPR